VQDVDTILAACSKALAECVAATAGAEVVAVAVAAAMHGLVPLDADLRPLAPLSTWADGRAAAEARELRASVGGAALHAATAVPVHPMTPLTKLLWWARHEPDTFAAARWWAGVKGVVLGWLSGTLVTELSSASGTGLLDPVKRTWHPMALDACGVDPDRLPPILSTTACEGLAAGTAAAVGLPDGTPVVAGAGDGPLGNLGTGAIVPGVAGLSLGTSGAVRVAVPSPTVDAGGRLFSYAITESLWVSGGALSNGASVGRWALNALAPDLVAPDHGDLGGGDDDVLDLAAAVPAGSEGLVALPNLLPERAPLWDPDLPGAFLGLRSRHTRAHLVRACVEGVAQQLRLILDSVDAMVPVTEVRATGGAFRSTLWRDVVAAALDRPLTVVDGPEGTALGAAALGLVGVGRAATLDEALALLAPTQAGGDTPVEADPALVAAYDRQRATIPGLVAALDRVAEAFTPTP
jgi:gluconokinase